MPELPEVEVLRRSLLRRLPGRRITRVETRAPTLREPLDRRRLKRLLEGRRVEDLRRRAKYLLIDVAGDAPADDATLVIHLGMSGCLTVVAGDQPYAEHEHFVCRLDGGRRLRLVDPRRFGLAFALKRGELAADRHFVRLGVEPLGGELTGAYLAAQARGRRAPVKGYLMDAGVVVGVGNIYASETLWRAGVHPRRSTARISAATWERLAAEVQAVLGDAIAQGGTTINDFADGDGNAGYFQVALAVYGREGAPCGRCGRPIRRLVQAGRSTYYCPGCQR